MGLVFYWALASTMQKYIQRFSIVFSSTDFYVCCPLVDILNLRCAALTVFKIINDKQDAKNTAVALQAADVT